MRIAHVLGTVTLNRQHPSLLGGSLRVASPLTAAELSARMKPSADAVVIWDEFGASPGDLVAVSEGAEAAQPFRPALKPIDAYCAAILDNVHLRNAET